MTKTIKMQTGELDRMDELDKHLIQSVLHHFALNIEPLPTTEMICPNCGKADGTILTRRRNTAYIDDAQNWLTSCQECFNEDYEYYTERWADYYSDCM